MSKDDNGWWEIYKDRLSFFVTISGCILLDSLFVIFWAIVHQLFHRYAIHWLEAWLEPSTLTEYLILGVKAGFDIVTLAIVLVFIYVDFRRIVRKIIEKAKEASQAELTAEIDAQLLEPSQNASNVIGVVDATKSAGPTGKPLGRQ
ncbi:MAG TPA: hypothetical protein VGO56_15510 [Pyrinomonadaceae bacterium]|jgi:hypothetical protein|nr:hypothetical protein [Pyrinomonadaceae bacterium]